MPSIEAVSHAPEWRAAGNLGQPKPFQNSYASGHETLAAWLFSRKNVPLEKLD